MKRKLYVTAKAIIGCAAFNEGDYVSVEYSHEGDNGTHWYNITTTQYGPLESPVMYPEHHLTDLCL